MTINDAFDPNSDQPSWLTPRFPRSGIPDHISADEFYRLLMAGRIVDGRAGGVILGKDADEGGPRGIFKIGDGYLIQGHFNGGDFVMNREAAVKNMKRLRQMNAGATLRETVKEEDAPGECGMLIVTTAYPDDRLIWLDFCQTVIKQEAAQKHLMELCRMNADNPYLRLNLHEVFGADPGTRDGIV